MAGRDGRVPLVSDCSSVWVSANSCLEVPKAGPIGLELGALVIRFYF